MTNVTCGLTAKKPVSASRPTLVIEYGTTSYVDSHAHKSDFTDLAASGFYLLNDSFFSFSFRLFLLVL